MPPGSRAAFSVEVYRLVRAVPPGRVTTYGTIARALGAPHGARQVGWALAALPRLPDEDVPAHRVVNAVGALSGGWAFGAPEVQRMLLEEEGVTFDATGRVPLAPFLWDPEAPEASADDRPPRPSQRAHGRVRQRDRGPARRRDRGRAWVD